mgnify:CR=1 FL=1
MPKYHVHLYPIVRVLVSEVEAETPEAAIKQAEALVDLRRLFSGLDGPHVVSTEYADDMDGFLVDEGGDPEHLKSTFYDAKYRPL